MEACWLLYRMQDATVFSIDVAVAKARNVVYFSSMPGLPGAYADSLPGSTDLPGIPPGTAVTNRTIGFGAQPLFPPGIDNSEAGPFFNLYVNDTANACTQGTQPPNPNQNGIVFFPGSAPLYRGGMLVGGLGVSGDGVDQDDFVTAAGTALQTLSDPSDSGPRLRSTNCNSCRPDRDRQRPATLHKVPAQSHTVISEIQQDNSGRLRRPILSFAESSDGSWETALFANRGTDDIRSSVRRPHRVPGRLPYDNRGMRRSPAAGCLRSDGFAGCAYGNWYRSACDAHRARSRHAAAIAPESMILRQRAPAPSCSIMV